MHAMGSAPGGSLAVQGGAIRCSLHRRGLQVFVCCVCVWEGGGGGLWSVSFPACTPRKKKAASLGIILPIATSEEARGRASLLVTTTLVDTRNACSPSALERPWRAAVMR